MIRHQNKSRVDRLNTTMMYSSGLAMVAMISWLLGIDAFLNPGPTFVYQRSRRAYFQSNTGMRLRTDAKPLKTTIYVYDRDPSVQATTLQDHLASAQSATVNGYPELSFERNVTQFSNGQNEPRMELSWVDKSKGKNGRPTSRRRSLYFDLKAYEEKEKKETEWLVQTTAKLIGIGEASKRKVGTMSQGLTHRAYLVMKAWAKRSEEPRLVELILRKLLEEREAGNSHVEINVKTYNIVLDAWSHSKARHAFKRAEETLLEMEELFAAGDHKIKANTDSYNAVIKAYVASGEVRDSSVKKVEGIIQRMETNGVRPNRRSYNLLLYAIANSSSQDAPQRANEILRMLMNGYLSGDLRLKPDTNTYNQVLSTWARGLVEGYEGPMQALFDELLSVPEEFGIHPNTDSFNQVLGGWLKSKDADSLENMEGILRLMEDCCEGGNSYAKPDQYTINSIIAAYAKRGNEGAADLAIKAMQSMQKKYGIKPNTLSHNIMVETWCKSGQKGAAKHVIELLDVMEREFIAGKKHLKPDAYTYSSVIDTLIKCDIEGAGEKAEQILARMKILHDNYGGDPASDTTYNAAINAWACSDAENAASRAEGLLIDMEEKHERDSFVPKPNTITYNTLIKVHCSGRPGGAERAEELLKVLEERMQQDPTLTPDSYSYTAVITAFGRSKSECKAEMAYATLQRMVEAFEAGNRAAKPTIFSFNAALNACAFVSGNSQKKVEAFLIVVTIAMMISQYAKPDQTTYGTILRACSTLLPPGDKRREELVERVFRKACSEGQVGRLVLKQVKFAASAELYSDLLMGRNIDDRIHVADLPPSWTGNVREKTRKRQT